MERRNLPALMPLEGAMLPAIELKRAPGKPCAALHAALARWKRPLDAQRVDAPQAPPLPKQDRSMAKAAYAHATRRKR